MNDEEEGAANSSGRRRSQRTNRRPPQRYQSEVFSRRIAVSVTVHPNWALCRFELSDGRVSWSWW